MTCNCGNPVTWEGEIAWHKCEKPRWYWNFTPILKPHKLVGGEWIVWSDDPLADIKYSHDKEETKLRRIRKLHINPSPPSLPPLAPPIAGLPKPVKDEVKRKARRLPMTGKTFFGYSSFKSLKNAVKLGRVKFKEPQSLQIS